MPKMRRCAGARAATRGGRGVPCTSPQRRRSTAGAGGSALQCQAAGSRACAQDRDLPRGARRGGAAQFNEEASRPGGARPVLVMTASTFIGEPQRLQRSASTSYTLVRSRAHAARVPWCRRTAGQSPRQVWRPHPERAAAAIPRGPGAPARAFDSMCRGIGPPAVCCATGCRPREEYNP